MKSRQGYKSYVIEARSCELNETVRSDTFPILLRPYRWDCEFDETL